MNIKMEIDTHLRSKNTLEQMSGISLAMSDIMTRLNAIIDNFDYDPHKIDGALEYANGEVEMIFDKLEDLNNLVNAISSVPSTNKCVLNSRANLLEGIANRHDVLMHLRNKSDKINSVTTLEERIEKRAKYKNSSNDVGRGTIKKIEIVTDKQDKVERSAQDKIEFSADELAAKTLDFIDKKKKNDDYSSAVIDGKEVKIIKIDPSELLPDAVDLTELNFEEVVKFILNEESKKDNED